MAIEETKSDQDPKLKELYNSTLSQAPELEFLCVISSINFFKHIKCIQTYNIRICPRSLDSNGVGKCIPDHFTETV